MSEIRDLPVAKVEPNPNQPRKAFPEEHIARIAASIQKRGLLQPITVRPIAKRYMIVAGECRWRACVLIKAPTIRSIIKPVDAREMQFLAIMENLIRRDMNPIEEANAFKTLADGGLSHAQVADELGLKSAAIVRQRIDLLDLSPDLQQLVASGNLPVNTAWGIAQAPVHLQIKLLRDVQSGRLRTSEQVKHAGIAMRDAAAQVDCFADIPKASTADLETLSRLERRIQDVVEFVAAGFKNGECVAAQRVSPSRVITMADKLALIRKHVQQMEHDLRRVATEIEIKMEFV
jgi:ParB family transcriptional regulator, chromosome partitioning protein